MSTTVATIPPRFTPAERLAQIKRLKQLLTGDVRIPLVCARCIGSSSLDRDSDLGARCIKCGHGSSEVQMHAKRRQRIGRFLRTGEL